MLGAKANVIKILPHLNYSSQRPYEALLIHMKTLKSTKVTALAEHHVANKRKGLD